MLGDVTPQTLRITPSAVVYPGRDNIVLLKIEHAGRGPKPVNLDQVTRFVLILPQLNPVVAFDSDTLPAGVLSWSAGVLRADLTDYAVPAATYRCQLIAYDAEHPSGQVLVDDVDSVLELSFRHVTTSGLFPLPLVEMVPEAPMDGGIYGRVNGAWRSIEAQISGVSTFNGRSGVVELLGDDVSAALGYSPATAAQGAKADSALQPGSVTPASIGAATAAQGAKADTAVQPGALAAVATSGSYADLADKPFIPSTAGDVGAATAAQGALADTAVQPQVLTDGLAAKVDKVAGKQLSTEDFTSAEKAKLAGLEGSHYRGTFTNLTALQAALPTASAGDYADVDAGVGAPVLRYIWDVNDAQWVAQAGAADPITAAQVKALYESNADTNAYTDSEKAKLGGVEAGATANTDTDTLPEGTTNLWFTVARVRATVLTGLSLATDAAIAAADSVLVAMGKLQAQISTMRTKLDGIAPNATANQTDAHLLARANHTGTQASATISDFAEAVQDVMGATLVQGANVTITYDDVANTITIASTGGGGTVQPWSVVESLAASKTLALADAGKYLRCTAAVTITVPPQSSVAWGANTEIHFERASAGAVTFSSGAGVTINKASSYNAAIAEQYVAVTLKRVAADTWTLIGALEVPA